MIWWMYGGYAWLTNAVGADTGTRRVLLLGGMVGYLVLALAIRTLAPYKLLAAALIVAGGAAGGHLQYVLWSGAALLEWLLPAIRRREGGFPIGAAHFVERHGLVVIVAIRESVVAGRRSRARDDSGGRRRFAVLAVASARR